MKRFLWAIALVGSGAISSPAVAGDYVCYGDFGDGVIDLTALCARDRPAVEVPGAPTYTAPTTTATAEPSTIDQRANARQTYIAAYRRSNPASDYSDNQIVRDGRTYCRETDDLAGNDILNDAWAWVMDQVDDSSSALRRETELDHWAAIHFNAPTLLCD